MPRSDIGSESQQIPQAVTGVDKDNAYDTSHPNAGGVRDRGYEVLCEQVL